MVHWRSLVLAMAPTAPSCLDSPGRRRKGSIRLRLKRKYPRFVPHEHCNCPATTPSPSTKRSTCSFIAIRCIPLPGLFRTPTVCVFPHSIATGGLLLERIFFSIGGGFIVSAEEFAAAQGTQTAVDDKARGVPYPFHSAQELLERAAAANITISQLMLANECALLGSERAGTAEQEVRRGILRIWQVMRECTQRGIESEGILPGGLKVRRRAAKLAARLRAGVQ